MFSFGESNSFPLSCYHSPSAMQESNITFPQQTYQQNLFQGPYNYMPSLINPSIMENPMNNNIMPSHSTSKLILGTPIEQEESTLLNCPSNLINDSSFSSKKCIATKKDRHTKISTAQGVRDRRVRLSISIAREFFNLQDMLGFDKASKTLGWLLAKSKAAIDDLTTTLKNNNGILNCSSSASEGQHTIEKEEKKQVLSSRTSRRKRGRKGKSYGEPDPREVRREKARERARERTINKRMVNITNLDHQRVENRSSSQEKNNDQRAQQNMMICQSNSATPSYGINPSFRVGESVVIKSTKLRGSYHNHHHQHDHDDDHNMGLKDIQEGCSYYSDYLTRFSLETNGAQALNIINLSTEIHINAKPWDSSTNQILH